VTDEKMMDEKELQQKEMFDMGLRTALFKGKAFTFVFVPIPVKSEREFKHWIATLDTPEGMRDFIQTFFEKYGSPEDCPAH